MIRPHGVGLYAPSGFAIDPDAVDRAVQRLEAMWERVVVDPTCRSRWQRWCRGQAQSQQFDDAPASLARRRRSEAVLS